MKKTLIVLVATVGLSLAQTVLEQNKLAPELRESSQKTGLEEVDVIVQYADTASRNERTRSAVWGAFLPEMESLPFEMLRVKRSKLATLASDPNVIFISPDRTLGATHFPPWMRQEAIGYRFAAMTVPERPLQTGTGVGIAIIDSGVSADDYLKDPATNCTTSRIVYSQNFVAGETTTNDIYGHGTHVAGIAAGNGKCLPGQNVDMSGVAPDAKIINLRVLDGRGQGKDSAVISAIDRAIALRTTYKIKIINLSLGRVIASGYTSDPLCQAVERAWKAGITVVVAAGNNGRDNSKGTQGYGTITSPANDPYVITVGSTRMVGHTGREDDTVTSYSSKGPTLRDQIVKPDLVAPGNIVYARMNTSAYLVTTYQTNLVGVSMAGGPNVPNIFLLSGTSMASPVVAGSAALLLQKDPTLTPDQIKARLMKTAFKGFVQTATITDPTLGQTFQIQHDLFTVGAGLVDLKSALASTEKSTAGKLALSPQVNWVNGKAVLSKTYPNLVGGTNVVWGSNVVWGENVVWGSNVVWGESVLQGSNVVWGTTTMQGYNVVWGENIVWGEASPFSESLSVRGDQ